MIKKILFYNYLWIVLGLLLLILYYYNFNHCIEDYCKNFSLPYNIPDHKIYVGVIEDYNYVSWWNPLLSNHGIAIIYYYIFSIFGVASLSLITSTLIVNLFLYILCIFSYLLLCKKLKINRSKLFLLCFYPPFLFLSALINKDIVMMLLVLWLCIVLIDGNVKKLILLTFAFGLVRGQYALLPLVSLFLISGRFFPRVIIIYFVSSIGTALIARYSSVFDVDFEAVGFTTFIYELNKKYFIGSLLFNPFRLFHYVLAFIVQGIGSIKNDSIDLMKFIEGITFFWFLFVIYQILKYYTGLKLIYISRGCKALVAVILGFIFMLLMTSITEVRYLTPIFPLLLMLSIVIKPVSINIKYYRNSIQEIVS